MNKTIAASVGLALALLASRSHAQKPAAQKYDSRRDFTISSSSQATPTPEMWFYVQERNRYEDPQLAVRRKAEHRAAQRSDRLAAMKWYGQSNSRPLVSATPFCEPYGVGWTSTTANPNLWRGSPASVVTRPSGSSFY